MGFEVAFGPMVKKLKSSLIGIHVDFVGDSLHCRIETLHFKYLELRSYLGSLINMLHKKLNS